MSKTIEHKNPAPVVWLLTDNKPGHRNQLKGLGNRLRVLAGASLYWVDANQVTVPIWRALLGMAPDVDQTLPKPDLIIAAGTGTHRLLLSLRRVRNAKTLVLMKPGFPLGWVSAAIMPAHDGVHASSRVLLTDGMINTVTPLARITDKPEALVLVGGPSPHFEWDSDVLLGQINHLIGHYPTWRWTISGSRRTPEDLMSRLRELACPRITVAGPEETHQNWLSHQLAASRAVWVSPDSMSMVCEAVTSGVPTGLFQLTPRPGSRVGEGVNRLIQEGRIARWSDHAAVMAGKSLQNDSLWEADRAARWVIARALLPAAKKSESGNRRKST
ncbi:mitochondrial fission ELM1 family protein [Marinobacter sp. F4206]|uniref:mitochondrial fission ELM1 family protein n=1 Tax=Marinobacter sp. F4206 TaxID=2861777 RepID=UPI001C5E99E2|nr:ELM1/GtrOC1 family putative glycosyltransferase [Marinobacter sp. F4206]MBW4936467.1 mitochondrial fission ELM1 family protein [Marinobacter sp. F4206]